MANVKLAQQAAAAVTVSGLSTLASGSYATSNLIDNTTNLYLDYLIELLVTTGTVSGNKQAVIFAISSLDTTNFSDNAAGDDANMAYLGSLQTPSNTTSYRSRGFSVAAAFGGTLPPQFKIVVKNDGGGTYTVGSVQQVASYQTVT